MQLKIGIMQPYFFPYIGYWQLINLVDKYVIFDDVNYIKRGWINRNRILMNGNAVLFNVPLLGVSQNKLINQIEVNRDKKLLIKNLKTIELTYRKAPYFRDVYPLVERILENEASNIADYNAYSIKCISEYLDIKTELITSSKLNKDNSLKSQNKILEICELLGATEYCNAIGGQELYSKDAFANKNIQLRFLKTNDIRYQQFKNDFVSNLSIIDVMMFNSISTIKEFLLKYTLV